MKDDHAQDGDPASPAARDLPPKVAWLLLAVTVGGAAVLRFYHLSEQGYRFCDEGYHLNLPILYLVDHQEPFLFFKHGLLWFPTGRYRLDQLWVSGEALRGLDGQATRLPG